VFSPLTSSFLANVLDGYTTVAHPEGYEEAGFPEGSAFLLRQHPSAARYVATMGALQVAASFAAYRLQHSQKRFLKLLGHALMIQGIYAHTDGYIGNALLLKSGPSLGEASPQGPAQRTVLVCLCKRNCFRLVCLASFAAFSSRPGRFKIF
jgi:hypothetical protein